MHFCNILIIIDNSCTFIVLTITVPVFDLGMSCGKVKSAKGFQKCSSKFRSKLCRNHVFCI